MVDFNGGGTIEFDEFLDLGFDQMVPPGQALPEEFVSIVRRTLTEEDYRNGPKDDE